MIATLFSIFSLYNIKYDYVKLLNYHFKSARNQIIAKIFFFSKTIENSEKLVEQLLPSDYHSVALLICAGHVETTHLAALDNVQGGPVELIFFHIPLRFER